MIYYIDPLRGSADADGLSPEQARKTYTDLTVLPGDTVLFRRGSVIRDCLYCQPGEAGKPVTYGAYGEGENPVFCGSEDVSNPAMWRETRKNVWEYTGKTKNEACNFIFDDGRIGGTLRWEEKDLCMQGDWYDSRMGQNGRATEEPCRLLLWSKGNPGTIYRHIECAVWGQRGMAVNRDWTVVENLCFRGSGVHGMAGGANHITIRRCSFCFIGGGVWSKELRIRFGNAIEFWNYGEDIRIEECYFNNVYDSCITHQGNKEYCPAKNLVMRGNLFIDYGMGAYEGRDAMPIDSVFGDNLCLKAGGGFSAFGDSKPRKSEIYPQPMGHHIFMWRMPKATEGGSFEISGNQFYDATGAAVYSIISPEAEAQMNIHDNQYWTGNQGLFQRVNGKNYPPDQFDTYMQEYRDTDSAWTEAPDLQALAQNRLAKIGCSRNQAKLFTDQWPESNNGGC